MDRSRVALIIPALNEAQSIGEVVAGASRYGVPVVVDDGSTDDTGAIARAAGAEVVKHPNNLGYDAALNTGFERASKLGCEWAVTLDADGQHDPTILGAFLEKLDEGADVVIGVRDRHQRCTEALFAWCGRRMWNIRDPLCGMKGYRMSVYLRHGCFDSCASIGTELAISAAMSNCDILEVPVRTRPRKGKPRFGTALRANLRILRALVVVAVKTQANQPTTK